MIDSPTTLYLAMMAGIIFGLVSVPHCIGMCGPLHLAMTLANSKRSFRSLTLFNAGRIAGYTLLGALCGLFGNQLANLFPNPSVEHKHTVSATGTSHTPTSSDSVELPTSCCPPENADATAPQHTHSQPAGADNTEASSSTHSPASHPKPRIGLPPLGRRILMLLFPAVILIGVGIKGLLKKPASVGGGSGGFVSTLFTRFKSGGPATCGVAASLIPCGMLYVAFGFAVSTLSPLLGGAMLFFYCLTISFFMQLGIMVGTTFGRKLGPAVNKAFPYIAFIAAAVYIFLFIRGS